MKFITQKYVRDAYKKDGLNTAINVFETLDGHVNSILVIAKKFAIEEGRKTVMKRDMDQAVEHFVKAMNEPK